MMSWWGVRWCGRRGDCVMDCAAASWYAVLIVVWVVLGCDGGGVVGCVAGLVCRNLSRIVVVVGGRRLPRRILVVDADRRVVVAVGVGLCGALCGVLCGDLWGARFASGLMCGRLGRGKRLGPLIVCWIRGRVELLRRDWWLICAGEFGGLEACVGSVGVWGVRWFPWELVRGSTRPKRRSVVVVGCGVVSDGGCAWLVCVGLL